MWHLPSPSVLCSKSCFAWSFVMRLLPSRYSLNFCRGADQSITVMTHKFQELLHNVYFRCLVCITWMRKQPTYHEIELLCFLLVSSSFRNARLTQVCLGDCWLHRLCWATVLETFWHIIVFNGDHILYCLQRSLRCFLNLVLKSTIYQMGR